MNCRPLSNCVFFCFVGSGVFWLTLRLRCSPSHALLPFSLSLFSRPAYLTNCYYVLSGPYQSTQRRRHALSTGLGGSLCRLVVLLAQCRTMVFLTYCERFLCTLEPAPMMLLPLMPIVFVALRHLPFLGIGL